jgi:hypothetical protein
MVLFQLRTILKGLESRLALPNIAQDLTPEAPSRGFRMES